jgi:hypothetical protein
MKPLLWVSLWNRNRLRPANDEEDDVARRSGRTLVVATVLAGALLIGTGVMAGSALASGGARHAAPGAHIAVAAPCASQGSCKYCGIGGIWTGNCTRAKLEYNVRWCGRHRHHLSRANKAKCKAEAGYLSSGPPNQLLPWVNVVCAPPNAKTIYNIVKGLAEKTGPVGVACAGISLYAGLHSLVVEIL